MKVAKWGNSLAVRLPGTVVQALGLAEGDEVHIEQAPSGALQISRALSPDELWARLHALRSQGKGLPAGFKFNREEREQANER